MTDEVKKTVTKTDEQWRALLDPMQYQVTRHAATERAFTGKFWDHHEHGIYTCVCCNTPLFASDAKFDKPAAAKPAGGDGVFGGGFVLPGEEPKPDAAKPAEGAAPAPAPASPKTSSPAGSFPAASCRWPDESSRCRAGTGPS